MSGTPDFSAVFEATRSLCQQLGLFESVDTHEAKNAPGLGLRVEIFWADPAIRPLPQASGLNITSFLMTLQIRVRTDFRQRPPDAIDPMIGDAAYKIIRAYNGDINISGAGATAVDWVDLLGMYAPEGVVARPGYIKQDDRYYRCLDVFVPYVITDSAPQGL